MENYAQLLNRLLNTEFQLTDVQLEKLNYLQQRICEKNKVSRTSLFEIFVPDTDKFYPVVNQLIRRLRVELYQTDDQTAFQDTFAFLRLYKQKQAEELCKNMINSRLSQSTSSGIQTMRLHATPQQMRENILKAQLFPQKCSGQASVTQKLFVEGSSKAQGELVVSRASPLEQAPAKREKALNDTPIRFDELEMFRSPECEYVQKENDLRQDQIQKVQTYEQPQQAKNNAVSRNEFAKKLRQFINRPSPTQLQNQLQREDNSKNITIEQLQPRGNQYVPPKSSSEQWLRRAQLADYDKVRKEITEEAAGLNPAELRLLRAMAE